MPPAPGSSGLASSRMGALISCAAAGMVAPTGKVTVCRITASTPAREKRRASARASASVVTIRSNRISASSVRKDSRVSAVIRSIFGVIQLALERAR